MIVVDASAMVESLVGRDAPTSLLEIVSTTPLAAPHLLDVEVLSTLRGLARGRKITEHTANTARKGYFALAVRRFESAPLAERIWELRHRCTAYDATYLSLAEALGAPLLTGDAKLADAGSTAELRLIGDLV